MHGKMSPIRHDGRGIFKSIPQSFKSTRYHSLSASSTTLPPTLAITAVTAESGVIMGVRHREYTLEAVQYHPESILSEQGGEVLSNFLKLKGGKWEENPESGVFDDTLPPFDIDALRQNMKPADSGTTNTLNDPATAKKVPSILEKIYAQRLEDVALAKATPGTTPSDLSTLLSLNLAPPIIPLVSRLKSSGGLTLMAEIKRASPSKGPIAMSTNAAQQALTYALSGASVISVLTEPTWFKGSLLDMRLAREAISALPNRPAILRKDFILDEYQIAEARLHGADTVLLIVAMLPPARLRTLYMYSLGLGMEPLVEVNNANEMALALELGAQVIGVNNRNLHDFKVDMGTTSRLVDMVKERDVILCALSGISTRSDVQKYTEQGVGAVLVGEALMRAADTKAFIRELLGWPEPVAKPTYPPLVKICGITSEGDAIAAADAGADMLGLMFVPTSKRVVSIEKAHDISSEIRSRTLQKDVIVSHPVEDELLNEPWLAAHARRMSSNMPKRPMLVGIFQNQPLNFVLHTVAAVPLDMVQLHGSEPVEWAKHISVPVIKAFHVAADGTGLEGITRPGFHEFVLLDSMRPDGLSGGSGKVVDWDLATKVVAAGEIGDTKVPEMSGETNGGTNGVGGVKPAKTGMMPIILAGGLTPENVEEAVKKVRPWAVDVSGGVEGADGLSKDIIKMTAFISAAKGK
jgi:anthranilate synthase / indole-3-glycerol phosphate synthase / phosphoribosylanthranilate isomerase